MSFQTADPVELDPELEDALEARYGKRPERLEQVLANARAWVRLTAMCREGSR